MSGGRDEAAPQDARGGSAAYPAAIAALFALAIIAETGLIGAERLAIPTAVLNLAFIAIALSKVRGYILVVSLACLACSGAIAAMCRVPAADVVASFNRSSMIIAFVAAIPAVGLPIRLGGYVGAMEAFVAGSGSRGKPEGTRIAGTASEAAKFLSLAAIHFLMSVVLNIGSIPTMQRLLDRSALPKRYLAAIYSAGYSSYMLLSPFDGVVNAILLAAGTTYAAHFPGGLSMAAFLFGAGSLILAAGRRGSAERAAASESAPSAANETETGASRRAIGAASEQADAARPSPATGFRASPVGRILEFSAHLCAMIGLSALAAAFLPIRNKAVSMALVIAGYSCVWLAVLRTPRAALRGQGRLYLDDLAGYRAFLPFLVSAGFLGAMSAHTPLGDALRRFVEAMSSLPRYFTLQAIMVGVAILCVAGVHMMVTVMALATTLSPEALGLSPPGFSLFLLSAWLVGMILSPFVPYTTVVARSIGEKPAIVGLRHDLPLALATLLVAPLLAR